MLRARMASGRPEQIKSELRLARARDRVHSAYLFRGPVGTGKQETAWWFARLLLCSVGEEDPCGSCHACLLSGARDPDGESPPSHPDLKWAQPEGAQLRIDQIRALQRELSLVAHEGGRRVALLLGAETLRANAANALLKVLEEPPPRTTWLLVTHKPELLPQTVRSRTIQLRFVPQSEAEIRQALTEEGFSEDDAWLVAALGGGSVGAARAWAERHLDPAREMCRILEERDATQI